MKVRTLIVSVVEDVTEMTLEESHKAHPDFDVSTLNSDDVKDIVAISPTVVSMLNGVDTKPEEPLTFEQMVLYNLKMVNLLKQAILVAVISTLKYPDDSSYGKETRNKIHNVRNDLHSLVVGVLHEYNRIVGEPADNCDICAKLSTCGGAHPTKPVSVPALEDFSMLKGCSTDNIAAPTYTDDVTQVISILTHKKPTTKN